jgi:tetratricopeptide (TPR) repeat protein
VARTEGFLGNGQEYLATTLLAAGNREKGTQEYRKAVKYWEDRKDYLAASWTPTNVFFEMTLYKRTEVADFLLVDALQAVRKHRYAKVESALSIHLRNFLNKLLEEKKADEAIRFLESAIVLGKTSGAFPAGMDEGNLRQGLDEFLWMKEAWDKVVTNGEALARLGREAKYPYREALGSFFAGWGSLKKGANADALARFEACIAVAGPAGDAMRLGYGWVGKCRALSAVGKYEEADAAARKGMEIYEEAGIGTGVTQARKAALENARAWSNQDKTEGYKRLVRNLSAAGPMGGVSLGAMAAADLARRVEGLEKATDVLEISRQENRLAFRNLLDGSSADVTLDPHFHYVNVSGVLFQVKGPELLLWSITADGGAPNAPGETTDVSGEDVIHECADFSNFGQRHLADPGSLLRVTSSAQLYRVKRP